MPHAPSVQLIPLLLASLLLSTIPTPARAVSLESVTAAYGLTSASYNFSVPATALDSTDADAWLTQNWDLNGKISFGAADL